MEIGTMMNLISHHLHMMTVQEGEPLDYTEEILRSCSVESGKTGRCNTSTEPRNRWAEDIGTIVRTFHYP